jgi:hypothetical protein
MVRMPSPPLELVAERRGDQVAIQFTVPNANTDGTRPANVERVDVYAYTGGGAATDQQLIELGSRVASVDVKAPRDPGDTVDPDEPSSDIQPLVGDGLDQGARARVHETIAPAVTATSGERRPTAADDGPLAGDAAAPLAGPPATPRSRIYIGVPITTRGRRGPPSNRAEVPLVPAPPPPPAPAIAYDENGITVSWPATAAAPTTAATAEGVLPSRPIGLTDTSVGYHVYEMPADTRLTKEPLTEPRFADSRMEWGAERCYAIRLVQTFDRLAVSSDVSPPSCVTLTDTFAPAVPLGLTALPTEGTINLIWDPNTEKDLAGYLVLRGTAPDAMRPVTAAPIVVPTYADSVAAGQRFFYAVQAVDTIGNVSAASAPVAEAAR